MTQNYIAVASTVLVVFIAAFVAVCIHLYCRKGRDFWQKQDDIAIAADLASLRRKSRPTPQQVREQAGAAAGADFCNRANQCTPNPFKNGTLNAHIWHKQYCCTLDFISVGLDQTKRK